MYLFFAHLTYKSTNYISVPTKNLIIGHVK